MDNQQNRRADQAIKNENIEDLNDLLQAEDQPNEREPVKIEKKRRLDLLGRERKKVKTKGWEEKLLAKLNKKKKKIGASLNTFKTKYNEVTGEENVPEGQYNFFFKFLRTSTDVRKLPIARNLFLKPVLIPLYQSLQLTYVTNDSLFWYYNLSTFRGLNYSGCFGGIKSIYLCSNGLIRYPRETYLDEYFFEDFAVAVSCPLWNPENVAAANSIVGDGEAFTAFGKNYRKYQTGIGPEVYALANMTKDQIADKLNGEKIVNMKGKLSEGIKELKKNGDFFYNGKIRITDFCPSVLRSFEETEFGALCLFEIDPNAYIERCVAGNAVIEIPNILYWDYLHSTMELIGILKLTTRVLDDGNNEKKVRFKNAYETYVENKYVFTAYKSHFTLFRKIVLTFLDSFRVRANIDKMKELSKLCDEFIEEEQRLNDFSDQKNMIRLFCANTRELCTMMFNYSIMNDVSQYISLIGNVCKKAFRTTKDPGELTNELRAVCVSLSDLLYNGQKPVIDCIRSVNAFLGSSTGGNLDAITNLAQGLLEQAAFQRDDINAVNKRKALQRLIGLKGVNDIIKVNLAGLVRGKDANAIRNDQNLTNMLNYYFDSLRLTERNIPNNDVVYVALPEGIKNIYTQRFQRNPRSDLVKLLKNQNDNYNNYLDTIDLLSTNEVEQQQARRQNRRRGSFDAERRNVPLNINEMLKRENIPVNQMRDERGMRENQLIDDEGEDVDLRFLDQLD